MSGCGEFQLRLKCGLGQKHLVVEPAKGADTIEESQTVQHLQKSRGSLANLEAAISTTPRSSPNISGQYSARGKTSSSSHIPNGIHLLRQAARGMVKPGKRRDCAVGGKSQARIIPNGTYLVFRQAARGVVEPGEHVHAALLELASLRGLVQSDKVLARCLLCRRCGRQGA